MNTRQVSLESLESFGDVAAEDDAVLDYFLTTDAVPRIESNELFLILGRKGSGKTALVRFFAEGGGKTISKSLSLRGYPWSVHSARIDRGAAEIEAYVSSWRYLISLETALLALARTTDTDHPKAKSIKKFVEDNFGGATPALGDVLRPAKIRLAGTSFEPEVFGFKLGSIDFERKPGDLGLGVELNALSNVLLDAAIDLAGASGFGSLLIHFDELDQGITKLDEGRKLMLVGLILAARDVRRDTREKSAPINPIVYLRTDLWDDLVFSDKNKISQTAALNLEWASEELLDLVNARLKARLGQSATWDTVSPPLLMRGSQTKWNHILNRTFLRPRDVIKFLNFALAEAKAREGTPLLLDNEDVTNARESYSVYLKAELDDEIIAHWPYWEQALQACSAISTVTFTRDQFVAEYDRRKSRENEESADDALRLLYRFSVIGYERRSGYGGSSWAFQYTNPEAGWDNSASKFKVHLGLKEYAKLREDRA
jgi:energy-coupling factor transporter ATP-binding protein EcfA2